MPSQRQQYRAQIIKLCDESIDDFKTIKQTALHMDLKSIRVLEAISQNRFQLLRTIYTQLTQTTSIPPTATIPASKL